VLLQSYAEKEELYCFIKYQYFKTIKVLRRREKYCFFKICLYLAFKEKAAVIII